MRHSKQIGKRLLVIMLMFSLLLSGSVNVLSVKAAEPTVFQTYVVSFDSMQQYVGEFLLYNDKVYINTDTVLNIGYVTQVDTSDYACAFNRGDMQVAFTQDEILIQDSDAYLPFVETMEGLCFNVSMPIEGTLVIQGGANLDNLEDLFMQIYKNPEYDMSGWQNLTILGVDAYEADIWSAIVTDAVLNFKPVSYITGAETTEQYENALWKLLLPQYEEDVAFEKQTLDITNTLKNYREWTDGLANLLKVGESTGFLGDYGAVIGAFGDATEILQADDSLNMIAYAKSTKDAEESLARAVTQVMKEAEGTNSKLKNACSDVLVTYEEQISLWESWAVEVVQGGTGLAEQVAAKAVLPNKWIVDLTKKSLDKVLGTQQQLDAIIMADRYLDIQNFCAEGFYDVAVEYYISTDASKASQLQLMYDLTNLYLKCGIQAWRAVSVDSELTAMAERRISMIQGAMDELEAFTTEEIAQLRYAYEVEALLKNCAGKSIEEFEEVELAPTAVAKEATIAVSYDQMEVDGVPLVLDFMMYAEMDHGAPVFREEHEGMYLTDDLDGDGMAECIGASVRHDQYESVVIYNTDGVFNVEVTCNESYPLGWSITDVNPVITISWPGQGDIVITDVTDYLVYSGMGWFIGFTVDHGSLK